MKNRKVRTFLTLAAMLMVIFGVECIAEPTWSGYKDFLIGSHLVYSATYSDQFRPTTSGSAKIVNDCNSIITTGVLKTGVKFCNSDGTVASCPYSVSLTLDHYYDSADRTYYPNLTAAASYKAFLEPVDGLHLYMNRSTVYYQ